MIDHNFKTIQHYKVGPLRNKWGYIIAIAEIDNIWMMKWRSPYHDVDQWRYFADHDEVIYYIELFNADRRY
jgi:hypothetical protein